jgi:hypothetical protein
LYNLPFGENQHFGASASAFTRKLISGWQLNAIGSAQGGFPFSIAGTDTNNVNEATALRADQVGNPYPSGFVKNVDHWFSPSAFRNPAAGNYGNTSRNLLRGPGVATLDASIFKNTKFERLEVQLRFESFNALNHPTFATPNSSVTNSALGTISATNSKVPARENQAAVRLIF